MRRVAPAPRAAGWLLLPALALALGVAGCGRRGAPVAPERRTPAAVQDLTAAITADGVRLGWTLPKIRADRSPLKEVRRTEVHRRLEAPGDGGPGRPVILSSAGLFGGGSRVEGFDRVADIVLSSPGAAQVVGTQVAFTDAQGLTAGRRYTYVVLAVDEQGRVSAPSNRIAVVMLSAPKAPLRLSVEAADREVRLRWEPPPALEDGTTVPGELGYNVFRTSSADAPLGRPVNPEPLTVLAYTDLGVQNEQTYYYRVQALLAARGPIGRPSEAIAATPEDRTPPGQPRGLVAVVAGTTVRLAWDAVADPDLLGYHVYRHVRPGPGGQRLTAAPVPATTYVDADLRAGQTYYYAVTAVDRARRANESVPSPEAAATLP